MGGMETVLNAEHGADDEITVCLALTRYEVQIRWNGSII